MQIIDSFNRVHALYKSNECHTYGVGKLFDNESDTSRNRHTCASWDWLLTRTKLSSISMLMLADVFSVSLLSLSF
jgi:hypothetical protein